jgi:glycosyltransferase involved in cell wall biosynthesis
VSAGDTRVRSLRRRRVLFLADLLPNGGLERQLALLATGLPEDWDVRIVTLGGGPYEGLLRAQGLRLAIYPRRARFDPLPALHLWRDILRWRPDIVHAWGWMAALAAGPLCRLLGLPMLDGMIRSGALEHNATRLKRLGMYLSTLVIANSRSGLAAWDIGPRKGRVVYNGFDSSRAQSALSRTRPRDPAGPFTIVMTGRMVPTKHFSLVIDAARRISDEEDGWLFLLVGHGPDREALKREAEDLVKRGVVEFPEPGLEILDQVARADVGLLMTDPHYAVEGLSNSILEYMALGLPVVCGDGGGNPELVTDGEEGLLIPPDDVTSLVTALTTLRRRPELLARMGASGAARVARDFSTEAMVRAMLRVYEEALATGKMPRDP